MSVWIDTSCKMLVYVEGGVTELERYEEALKSQKAWSLIIDWIRYGAVAVGVGCFVYTQITGIKLNALLYVLSFVFLGLTVYKLVVFLSGDSHKHFIVLKSICGGFSESDTELIEDALSLRLKHRSSCLPVCAPESELIQKCVVILRDKGKSRLCSEIMELVEHKE